MPRWPRKVLTRIRAARGSSKVQFTLKALRELAGLEAALDEEDACDILANLTAEDSAGRLAVGGDRRVDVPL